MPISCFQRIKRPHDQTNAPPQSFFSLKQFERPANTPVAIRTVHSRHVRMEKNSPVGESHKRQREADEAVAVEGAQNLPSRLRSHDEERRGFYLDVLFAPDFLLQVDTPLKLVNSGAFSYEDLLAHQALRASAFFSEASLSARFAASQYSSICSRGTSASALPLSAAIASMRRNRVENFALAFFSA